MKPEEKGLLGSKYYSEHPVYPLEKTSVDLNIDMVGRIDPTYKGDSTNYLYIIGDDKLSSDLQPMTDKVNQHYNLELDRKYNDPKDMNRFYYRSDHYNFAAKGVPVIFYFNGTRRDGKIRLWLCSFKKNKSKNYLLFSIGLG